MARQRTKAEGRGDDTTHVTILDERLQLNGAPRDQPRLVRCLCGGRYYVGKALLARRGAKVDCERCQLRLDGQKTHIAPRGQSGLWRASLCGMLAGQGSISSHDLLPRDWVRVPRKGVSVGCEACMDAWVAWQHDHPPQLRKVRGKEPGSLVDVLVGETPDVGTFRRWIRQQIDKARLAEAAMRQAQS